MSFRDLIGRTITGPGIPGGATITSVHPLCRCGFGCMRRFMGRWFCLHWRPWNFWKHRGWERVS